MNKVGILTFHYANNRNFGASLQSYAITKMVKKLGNDAYLIDFNPINLGLKGKILFKLNGQNFKNYYNKFLRTTKNYKTLEELKLLNKEFDTFIVGSDQVWRSKWLQDKLPHYYFDFVDNNKTKVAYAASFGVDFWEGDKELTERIKPLAQRFDYVSVREESGLKICNDVFGIDAVCVLDPTMMIDRKDYQPILDDWKDESHKNKKYIAHMLLDDTAELREESNRICKYLKADINYIKGKDIKILGKIITFYNKVSQWLTFVKDAEMVITDSFHCTVFSLIFNKKFVVVANPTRGMARLENLLEIVGLKERFFTDIKD
ncbi:polysaccharide pyruvyl transferase family protein, partial [Cetobacterium sp.]|uniref:polysaccharide pyruvyl transferase family protein n=1 Tax=Cetobacterium sp. TaxID=2071632 RepID=UPI003EE424F7